MSLLPSPRALLAIVRSFFTTPWQLSHYPIRLIEQAYPPDTPDTSFPRWRAQVENWLLMAGYGKTPEAAMSDLRVRFAEYASSHSLPRPGTRFPHKLEMAPTEQIERYRHVVNDLLDRVVGIAHETCLVTDESSLSDFSVGSNNDEYFRKIRLLYNVDPARLPEPTLVAIARLIQEHRGA